MNNFLKFNLHIKLIFLLITLSLFFYSLDTYLGKNYIYLFFTLTIIIFFLNSFNNNKIKFFEFFLSIFFWLGFFFKFIVCTKIINIFPEGIGNFDFTADAFDEVMIISSLGIWGFYFGYYITPKRILNINPISNYLEKFYLENDKLILYFVIFFVMFFSAINFVYGIFQKGFVSNLVLGGLLRNIIAYLILIGFGTIIAFIINFEINRNRFSIIYLSLFETFLSSFSTLSRAMIFNIFPFLVGYIAKINTKKIQKINLKKILVFIFIFVLLFSFSVISTSKIRSNKNIYFDKVSQIEIKDEINKFDIKKIIKINSSNIAFRKNDQLLFKKIGNYKNDLTFKFEHYYKIFFDIIMYRFIGIEGVMAVQNKDDKSFELYSDSLKEKYKENNLSFYDKNFLYESSSYLKSLKIFSNQHAITLPGFIAHSYYTGSPYFVFFASLCVSFFCNLILLIINKLFNNICFTAFVANLLAYRIIHWGYAPINSYKLILGILVTTIGIIFLNYAIKKFYFKK